MGDIEPTPEDDEDRPLMDSRPNDGMDVSQHHKMMWAESLTGFDFFDDDEIKDAPDNDPRFETFRNLVRGNVVKIGKVKLEITNLGDDYTKVAKVHGSKGRKYWILKFNPDSNQVSVYQGKGGTMDHDPEPKVSGEMTLVEMSAISGGGAGLASSGKVSATSSGNAWKKQNSEHELMWSGNEPHDKRPKPGVKKKSTK